jgi:hypothetical protein
MSMVTINWNPDKKLLRTFGTIALHISVILFLVLYLLKGMRIEVCLIIFSVGLFIFISSRISLKLTKFIYLGLTLATLPIGLAVSFIVLAAFYFLLLTPLALIFRLFGRDCLNLRFKPSAKSFWEKRAASPPLERYFRQF